MRALQALQPQIKAIQEKYKNDRQRQQQEMMRFYQENKINPLASACRFSQLPSFSPCSGPSAETASRKTSKPGAAPAGSFITRVIEKPHGAELIVLLILFAGSMALSTYITMRSSPTAAGAQQYVMLAAFALVGLFSYPPSPPASASTGSRPTSGPRPVLRRGKLIPAPAAPSREELAAAKPPPPPPKKKKSRR